MIILWSFLVILILQDHRHKRYDDDDYRSSRHSDNEYSRRHQDKKASRRHDGYQSSSSLSRHKDDKEAASIDHKRKRRDEDYDNDYYPHHKSERNYKKVRLLNTFFIEIYLSERKKGCNLVRFLHFRGTIITGNGAQMS